MPVFTLCPSDLQRHGHYVHWTPAFAITHAAVNNALLVAPHLSNGLELVLNLRLCQGTTTILMPLGHLSQNVERRNARQHVH